MNELYIRFMAPVIPETVEQLTRVIDKAIGNKARLRLTPVGTLVRLAMAWNAHLSSYGAKMKNILVLAIVIFFLSLSKKAWPGDFSCQVVEGVYKAPGTVHLEDVSKRDPAVIGKVFRVNRTTGEVFGDLLFTNSDDKVKILRNVNELINTFEVMSTNKHSDVKLLSIDEHENKITFKYYFDWLGLFLTGTCSGT